MGSFSQRVTELEVTLRLDALSQHAGDSPVREETLLGVELWCLIWRELWLTISYN